MRDLINIVENAQGKAFFHGTSTDQADYLSQHGFGTKHRPQGMSSVPEETRKFTCITPSKSTGIWYARSNLKHVDGGAVVQVRFDAHPYVVKGHSDIYKAFAQAGDEFGVPRHDDGQLDMTGIADALVAQGYNAVAFKDGWSSGRATLAVLTPGEISYVRRV